MMQSRWPASGAVACVNSSCRVSMSRAVLDTWGIHEYAPGLYPERQDPKPGKVDNFISGLLGRWARRGSALRLLPGRRFAKIVLALAPEIEAATESELQDRVSALRAAMAVSGLCDRNAAEAFALVRELCSRRLEKRHYPVQLMGGYTLLQGGLAEMMTGEGKTLTAVLPAVAVALSGIPVHIITVNGYLARRDSEYLAEVYGFFGLSVGLIVPDQEPPERVLAYGCDVTYCVNKDLVFDYLRDRITQKHIKSGTRAVLDGWLGKGQAGNAFTLLRGLYYAIVDEADSVLIDEARTPLIISAENDDPNGRAVYEQALALAVTLNADEHYRLRIKERSIELTEAGRATVSEFAQGLGGLWSVSRAREELVEQGLSALHLFALDRHYIISDEKGEKKVQIVDEYTGRVMADRSWEKGLHQMIEVKEALEMTKRRDTISRITYQRYFRRYLRLAGMSGTVTEVAPEMRTVYGLDVLRIPPNRPCPAQGPGPEDLRQQRAALGCRARRRRGDERGGPGRADRHPLGRGVGSDQRPSHGSRTCPRGAQRAPGRSRSGKSSPRPASPAGSPSPPTWPGAAPTSCWRRRCGRPAACT